MGALAAIAGSASFLGAGQGEVFAQDVDQALERAARIHLVELDSYSRITRMLGKDRTAVVR